MAIYFFSFGDEKYTNSKIRIKQEAENFRIFDDIKIYGREDIGQDFIDKTSPYINMSRGGGYWLWKPYFLKRTFDRMQDGDYCIYTDCGCTINPIGQETLKSYFSLLDEDGSGIFRYSFGGTKELLFTSTKVFEYFGKDNDQGFMESDCLMATILIFKKCQNSTDYVNKFLEIAENEPSLFSDEYNDYKRHPNFIDSRHDQAVSACLAKMGKVFTYQDETYAPDMEGWKYLFNEKKVPFLATRIRN
jgi:hypothetical protein